MLKLLHIADLHLDSPMNRLSFDRARDFIKRQRKTVVTAIDFAKAQHCALVLIAGDLFDSEYYSKDTLDFLADIFKNNPEIRFIISPGNHDPLTPDSLYLRTAFPENVFIFKGSELSCFEFPELELTVYGYAFTSKAYRERPLSGFTASGKGYNLLCAHAELSSSPFSDHAPISVDELSRSELDYAALGHIHATSDIMRSGRTAYAYSGCLCGRDFSENGEKGGILVTLNGENVKAERVTFCPWEYRELEVDITNTLESDLETFLREKANLLISQSQREFIIRIKLIGCTKFAPSCTELEKLLDGTGIVSVKSELTYLPPDGFENDLTIKGELYRQLKDRLTSSDVAEREQAFLALKYALSALDGNLK